MKLKEHSCIKKTTGKQIHKKKTGNINHKNINNCVKQRIIILLGEKQIKKYEG